MLTKTNQIKVLEESNELLENYFRNTIITQLFIDADLLLKKYTPPVMKEFRICERDIGKHISYIKDKFRFERLEDDIRVVMESGCVLEKEVETTDGRWYQMNIIPFLLKKENRTSGVIVTFIDITKRIKALTDLEQVIADHENILDTISHDIRTPLSTLLAAFDLIQTVPGDDSAQVQKLLLMQTQSIEKMKHLIYELTDTREQEHRFKLEKEVLNFEHMLEDVRLTLNSNIAESGAVIRSIFNVSQITFPQRILRSILYNLVANAVKYSMPGRKPAIFVATEREDNFIVLSVKDNGLGIEESRQEQVFSKYFRIAGTTEGSGIGLHLVKQNVIRNGGRVTLQSEPGKGSEFKVYLKAQ